MRRVLGLTLLLLVGASATVRASADHTHQPVVDGLEPAIDGVSVEVRAEPAPTLVVRNTTRGAVEVLDDDGVPFLRIGPDDVQANVASPDFYRSESPSAAASVPSSATGGERFVHLVDGSDWAWFEHRIAATAVGDTWSVPLRIGGRDAAVTGRWEPVVVPARVEATVEPVEIDGLDVAVLPGLAPALFVENDTGEALAVPDEHGAPFLLIGPDRTTRATPDGGAAEVAPTASYAWVDARLGFQGEPPGRRTSRDWEIPARLGDLDLTLTGTTSWIPLDEHDDGGGISRTFVAVVVAVLVAVGAGALIRDRRGGNG